MCFQYGISKPKFPGQWLRGRLHLDALPTCLTCSNLTHCPSPGPAALPQVHTWRASIQQKLHLLTNDKCATTKTAKPTLIKLPSSATPSSSYLSSLHHSPPTPHQTAFAEVANGLGAFSTLCCGGYALSLRPSCACFP